MKKKNEGWRSSPRSVQRPIHGRSSPLFCWPLIGTGYVFGDLLQVKCRRQFVLINHLWSYRKETPEQDGRHDYNFIYALSLTETERKQAETHLDPVEYEVEKGLTPFASATLLTAIGARDVLIDCYQALFPEKE